VFLTGKNHHITHDTKKVGGIKSAKDHHSFLTSSAVFIRIRGAIHHVGQHTAQRADLLSISNYLLLTRKSLSVNALESFNLS
jgi:hypothetical protein